MRSTFFGIEIGKSGVNIGQLGLDVTGHNISNVETRGYTRQRIVTAAYEPFANIGKFAPVDQALIGGGVRVRILEQMRDAHLDRRFRTESTTNSYWQARMTSLRYVESHFDNVNEETSINFSLARFFEAMKILAEDPVEGAPRTMLQTAGMDLVQQLNSVYDSLMELQEKHDLRVETTVAGINSIAESIAELNLRIYAFEVTGHIANDLRDMRNVLVDDLATLIDIEYREVRDPWGGSLFIVEIGGRELVNHGDYNILGTIQVANVVPGGHDVLQPVWMTDRAMMENGMFLESDIEGKQLVAALNRFARDINRLNNEIENDPTPALIAERLARLTQLQDYFDDNITGAYLLIQPDPNDPSFDPNYDGRFTVSIIDDPVAGVVLHELVLNDGITRLSVELEATEDSIPLVISGGELQAQVDMRDNDTNHQNRQGIPYYIEMLNDLARVLVQEINRVHREGWTDSLAPGGSKQNINFFDDTSGWFWSDDGGLTRYTVNANGYLIDENGDLYLDGSGDPVTDPMAAGFVRDGTDIDISLITAKNLRLSDDVLFSAFNIATSSEEIIRGGAGGDMDQLVRGNNENMNKLYALFLERDLAVDGRAVGSFDGYATSIRFDLANTLNFARRTADTTRVLTLAAENHRTSVSGVSLDEEMTNLIKYQHAYNGAARVITAMDDALDRLINGTGRVGL